MVVEEGEPAELTGTRTARAGETGFLETLWLTNIDFFLQLAIKECCLDIHLIDGHVFTSGIGDEDSNSLDAYNRLVEILIPILEVDQIRESHHV
ncbi:hypothetical protein Tco_0205792 [Tanacetum coccineum]